MKVSREYKSTWNFQVYTYVCRRQWATNFAWNPSSHVIPVFSPVLSESDKITICQEGFPPTSTSTYFVQQLHLNSRGYLTPLFLFNLVVTKNILDGRYCSFRS